MDNHTSYIIHHTLFIITAYIKHWFSSKPKGGFGIHSPFVYRFVTDVIECNHQYYAYGDVERFRRAWLSDKMEIDFTDYGTGTSGKRKICNIAKKSLKSKDLAQLIYRIALSNHSHNILELGTSLGITTMYLALTDSTARVVSLEGCQAVANCALSALNLRGIKNVEIITGNIDNTIKGVVSTFDSLDFVLFDANHRKEPTMYYFNECLTKVHDKTIFVFDDINHSDEMREAWKEICGNEKVRVTIDIFHLGIVFFDKKLKKEHYKIRY